MVLKTFVIFFMILIQFIFQLQYYSLEKVIISLFKCLTAEKRSPLLWNVIEKILHPKKKIPPGTQKEGRDL